MYQIMTQNLWQTIAVAVLGGGRREVKQCVSNTYLPRVPLQLELRLLRGCRLLCAAHTVLLPTSRPAQLVDPGACPTRQEACVGIAEDGTVEAGPSIQEWLSEAKARHVVRQDTLQRQKQELEQQLAEQKSLLKSVASQGELLLSHSNEAQSGQAVGGIIAGPDSLSEEVSFEPEDGSRQMRKKWQLLHKEVANKQRILLETLQQDTSMQAYGRASGTAGAGAVPFLVDHGALERSRDSVLVTYSGLEEALDDAGLQGKPVSLELGLELEQKLFTASKATSGWLDGMEDKLFASAAAPPDEMDAHLCVQETLYRDVARIAEEVDAKKQMFLSVLPAETGNGAEIGATLATLWERLGTLEHVVQRRSDALRGRLAEVTEYQTELSVLQGLLSDHKSSIQQKLADSLEDKVSEQLQVLEDLEAGLRALETRVSALKDHHEELDPAVLQESHRLQDTYEELMRLLGARRAELGHDLALEAQLERALRDLSDMIDMGNKKLAFSTHTSAGSREQVSSQLHKHKDFFQSLAGLQLSVEGLAERVCRGSRQRHAKLRSGLLAAAATLQDRAHERGVQLERILQMWGSVEAECRSLAEELHAMESGLPTSGTHDETEEALANRAAFYKKLKESLAERQPRLHAVLEDGRQLLGWLSCPALDSQLTELGERWLSASARTARELQRAETLLHHSARFQKESAELSEWLEASEAKVDIWRQHVHDEPQDPDVTRQHLSDFLTFSKEVDARVALKASVMSTGGQLQRLKRADVADVRARLAQLDERWCRLLALMPLLQDKLQQAQMERLPSREAMTEMVNWMELMEKMVKDDEIRIQDLAGADAVKRHLQKYRGYKVELGSKQLVVDFVNQSMQHVSGQDVESKRSDKTDFAERLGTMNQRWQLLQATVTNKVQELEAVLDGWAEHESSVQSLRCWLQEQSTRLQGFQRAGDQASVRTALKECQEMEEQLRVKEKEVEKVEHYGLSLGQGRSPAVSEAIMSTLKDLNQLWASVDHQVGQLKIGLQAALEQWRLYREALEDVNGRMMENSYKLARYQALSGSLEAAVCQEGNLKNLQEEVEKHEGCIGRFSAATEQLTKGFHPASNESLKTTHRDVTERWSAFQRELVEALASCRALLSVWSTYRDRHAGLEEELQRYEERSAELLKTTSAKDSVDGDVALPLLDCQALQSEVEKLHGPLVELSQLGEQLRARLDEKVAARIKGELGAITLRLENLQQALTRQQGSLQGGLEENKRFFQSLESLEGWAKESEEVLKRNDPNSTATQQAIQDRMQQLKEQMLKFGGFVPELDRLNELGYRLPLDNQSIRRLQLLNRRWTLLSGQTCERFSKLQEFLLQRQSFLEKCENWLEFLEHTEDTLATEIAGSHDGLLAQQRSHELFQAEMFSRQQILHSIIVDGHNLLDQGEVEDRDEFNLKLTLLSDQWQGVVRRAQQRKGIIDGLLAQWQRYQELAAKLRATLEQWADLARPQPLPPRSLSLQQARALLDDLQMREKAFLRQQGNYIVSMEAGKQLLLSADASTEEELQAELTGFQQSWKAAGKHLEQRRRQVATLLQEWESCEKEMAESLEKLRGLKIKLSNPLPEHHDDLKSENVSCKELESSVEDWASELTQLTAMRDALARHFGVDDISGLQERMELLQRQWEELGQQVSLRKQMITERLNKWSLFNEKYKKLCEWLGQMESKVTHNGDVSIEEMLEKLQKEYQQEMNAGAQHHVHLDEMGRLLMGASSESTASEIEYKLSKVADGWRHLQDLLTARVKKLRDTLVAVQQLERNMSSLRSWLSHIEAELSRPLVYESCERREIQRQLGQQQQLQRDIEKHSAGVGSVLSLCEVLLHDCDACATETECDSIQQATRNLDRRWRNICTMSMDRKYKIEETWHMWQKFQEDYSRFEEWLRKAEITAASPNTSGIVYLAARDELKKFEGFQRQVHESLTQLELINKQYRRLARESRTDSTSRLRHMVLDGNQRWDELQKRVAIILRRLRHFIGQREEFEASRETVLVWLTEMDLQLTNVEHFSECSTPAKIRQLQAFQKEIALNRCKLGRLEDMGQRLMVRSEPGDSAVVEDELEELRRYCAEVFGRVERYLRKLTTQAMAAEEAVEELGEVGEPYSMSWYEDEPSSASRSPGSPAQHARGVDAGALLDDNGERFAGESSHSPLRSYGDHLYPDSSHSLLPLRPRDPSVPESSHSLSQSRLERERGLSGRDTPASIDSLPLEWDNYDIGKELDASTSMVERLLLDERLAGGEDEENEVSDYYSRSGLSGDAVGAECPARDLGDILTDSERQLQRAERAISGHSPAVPELDSEYKGYMKLLSECQSSIEMVKCVSEQLSEDDKMPGLDVITTSEKQSSGVIERWELMEAQALGRELRLHQDLQQWDQLNSDVEAVWDWLSQAEDELGQLQRLHTTADIRTIEARIQKLKELRHGMETRKAVLLSINLCSGEFTPGKSAEVGQLRQRLRHLNQRWERVAQMLETWRLSLQDALMHCQDFHEMSHGLLVWLENLDRKRNEIRPISPSLDLETLQDHHRMLMQVKRELQATQEKVASLQDMSSHLLVNAEGQNCLEAEEKVHVIANRLKHLLNEADHDIRVVERYMRTSTDELDSSYGSPDEELNCPMALPSSQQQQRRLPGKDSLSQSGATSQELSQSLPGVRGRSGERGRMGAGEHRGTERSLLRRVLRAALPLHLFMLLLLGLACLVPISENDLSCTLTNNFARSFHPMLRYTNGPPPI